MLNTIVPLGKLGSVREQDQITVKRRQDDSRTCRWEAGTTITTRILLVNEPRSYREAIAGAFKTLLWDAIVVCADAQTVDSELSRVDPHVVISSQFLTIERSRRPHVWITLYPAGGLPSEINIIGQPPVEVRDIELDGLLAAIVHVNRSLTLSQPDSRV